MDESDTPIPPACHACGHALVTGASRCGHCGAFQDWRFKLNFWLPVVGLVFGAVSITPITVGAILNIVDPPRAEFVLTDLDIKEDDIAFELHNAGSLQGKVEGTIACRGVDDDQFLSVAPQLLFFYDAAIFVLPDESVEISGLEQRSAVFEDLEGGDIYWELSSLSRGIYHDLRAGAETVGVERIAGRTTYRCAIQVSGNRALDTPEFIWSFGPNAGASWMIVNPD